MAGIEIKINGRKYLLSGEDSDAHLNEVAQVVQEKIEALRKEKPSLNIQNAAILAAFDFASQSIKGRRRGNAYRSAVLTKANELLKRVETELNPPLS